MMLLMFDVFLVGGALDFHLSDGQVLQPEASWASSG